MALVRPFPKPTLPARTTNPLTNRPALVAVSIFSGILLSELNASTYPLTFSPYSLLYVPPFVIISLILMSFPAEYQNSAPWSAFLLKWHYKIFPKDAVIDRCWPTMGALLLCLTIVMSPHLRRALSHRVLLWLGKISFPLYLLHGSFMRSILAWLLFANSALVEMEERDGAETYVVMRYPLPDYPTFVVVMPIFFAVLFGATHVWANRVEPHFGTVTKRLEEVMMGKETALPVVRKD